MKLLSGLRIVPLDNQIDNTQSLTPKLPFSMLLSASKGKGKTSTLLNMLLNKDMLAQKFNQIHIISPTNKLDVKFNILKESKGIILPNYKLIKEYQKSNKINIVDYGGEAPEYNTMLIDSDFTDTVNINLLKGIIKEQKMVIEKFSKEKADNVLLIYDDTASQKKFWNSQAVQQLMFNSRHYKVSLIITTQAYHSIPKPLRLNMSIIIIYYTANVAELKQIYDENNSNLTFKEFHKMFTTICNDRPYNFLTINYSNDEKHRYEYNLEHFVKN